MADFGSTYASKVNSTAAKLKITYGGVTSEFLLLQDMSFPQSHVEYREPTTSGGPIYFSGQPANRVQGTILFSTDAWKNATNNLVILTTYTNGEVPIFKLVMTFVDSQGSPVTDTFTYDPAGSPASGAKIESIVTSKSPEGGVKMSISIILIGPSTPPVS